MSCVCGAILVCLLSYCAASFVGVWFIVYCLCRFGVLRFIVVLR